jgi:hypothetical protein
MPQSANHAKSQLQALHRVLNRGVVVFIAKTAECILLAE